MNYELLIPGFRYQTCIIDDKELAAKWLFQIYCQTNKIELDKIYIFGIKHDNTTSYYSGKVTLYPSFNLLTIYDSSIKINVDKEKSIINKYSKYNFLKYLFLAEKKGILKKIPKDIIFEISLFIC